MKKEYDTPTAEISNFDISSSVITYSYEEDIDFFGSYSVRNSEENPWG